jgi:hypothetical protein
VQRLLGLLSLANLMIAVGAAGVAVTLLPVASILLSAFAAPLFVILTAVSRALLPLFVATATALRPLLPATVLWGCFGAVVAAGAHAPGAAVALAGAAHGVALGIFLRAQLAHAKARLEAAQVASSRGVELDASYFGRPGGPSLHTFEWNLGAVALFGAAAVAHESQLLGLLAAAGLFAALGFQGGRSLARMPGRIRLFAGSSAQPPSPESCARAAQLAIHAKNWSAGHRAFAATSRPRRVGSSTTIHCRSRAAWSRLVYWLGLKGRDGTVGHCVWTASLAGHCTARGGARARVAAALPARNFSVWRRVPAAYRADTVIAL